jgi:hypothetical protein
MELCLRLCFPARLTQTFLTGRDGFQGRQHLVTSPRLRTIRLDGVSKVLRAQLRGNTWKVLLQCPEPSLEAAAEHTGLSGGPKDGKL